MGKHHQTFLFAGPVVPGIPSPGSVDLERSDSSQLAQKNQEIEELRTQLRAKADLDTRVTELERENDKLIKLNHDLTYGHSNHLTQQLMEVNQQLDLCRKELTMVKKDYQDLLQENEHVVKRNLILEKNVKERESLIPEQLSNGHLSPSEDSRIQGMGFLNAETRTKSFHLGPRSAERLMIYSPYLGMN